MTLIRAFRRSRPRRRENLAAASRTATAVAALVLLAVGCGSDGTEGSPSSSSSQSSGTSTGSQEPSASTWAQGVCSTASDWKVAVDTAQATLSDKANLSANGVRDALDSVAAATDSLVADLTNLGPPDTAAGHQAQAQLSALASQLQQQKDTITGATSQSPTTARELLVQVSTITGALATMLSGVTATVQNISQLDGAEELESAFQTTPACQQLHASANASP